MKKYIKIIVSVFAFLALFSCEDELNQIPLSQGTTENFYSTENDFIQARNATYSIAFHGTGTYGYANRLLNLSETRSDNLYGVTQASRAWEGINNFFTSISSNSLVKEAYVSNYNAIYKANQLIEQIELKGDVIVDDNERDNMKAEAHFLRAFCYFDLIRWFGKVPLIDKTLSPQEVATIGRADVSKIYELIISDLELAIDKLAPSYPDAEFGRVTKYGAKGILALVYMTRSSDTYAIEGATLGLDEWDKAYQQLNDIKNSQLFEFGTDYNSIFRVEGNLNKENVLTIPYAEDTGNGVGGNFMIEVGDDNYFHSLGLNDQGSLERRPVSVTFRNSFDANDERASFGIIDDFEVTNASSKYFGTYTDRTSFIKYIDINRYGNGREDWGVDFMVIRYTDVLMLMAECTLHGGGGTQADVDDIVNDVRERAGLARDASGVTLEQLFEERRKEFFSEGSRWFDLIRSGNAITIMNDWKTNEDLSNSIGVIDKNSLLYPIPLQELLTAPDLYEQNPGYDN
ncbi:RagB/SusD family nutrient uptake outer membrane protein [Wenyingzhuangia sp. chi5]|uniref:RagB/SusD family nutrient uptake outer membrane protein n=1 Tax=Wenyingzhuangia gilva TaxID=3057677 RepID=A0ABT8VMU3_9FLAO|nr:RagB/SusD family nutrient uptake outer membrane protein [Wenyingzhuangia sp. chi5]MDO3693270.1 RagB/SusD family nutrient uptake outer membrane protein [Wenyingzhuangia sp. chi5]